jgi:hypothetical protein
MSTPAPDAATAAVLQALQTLYHDPEASHKRSANEWLEVFQHSVRGRLFPSSTYRARTVMRSLYCDLATALTARSAG